MHQHTFLATKLYIPPVRRGLVPRPRLIGRLNAGLRTRDAFARALTLVSAPAGFGKTTLASEWVQTMDGAAPSIGVAWIALDEGDNDLARFLGYLTAALRTVDAGIGKGLQSALQSPQPPPAEVVLISLINDMAALSGRIVLVLDDYHLIDAGPIHDALTFLLEHLPPHLHLVIASREDPPLPLARLRARRQLIELRASDLRFSSPEVAEFLNQVMGLDLSAQDISALEGRTEGWITGLHLAAISMQGRQDVTGFINAFTGSHRYVLDYLIEEVLEGQPKSVQTFLLQTSVLDRLTGPLCDAVRFGSTDAPAGQDNGQATLEMLERANLFIVPLDQERRWYRYHHLFSDLLRRRLDQLSPDSRPGLHRRASAWYEQNGFADEATDHALRAGDFERVARLIEEHVDAIWQSGEHTKLWRWLEALPAELLHSSPDLCVFFAWNLYVRGRQDAAEQSLQAAEQALDVGADLGDQSQVPDPGREKVRGRIAVIRALLAFFRGDVPAIIRHARQALKVLPESDSAWRSSAAISLGDAYRIQGDITEAYRARLGALEISQAAGNVYMILIASMKLAVNMRQQGRLAQVKGVCEQQLQLAKESGLSHTAVAGGFLAIGGEVQAELDDLAGALDRSRRGVELAESGEDMVVLGWSYLCLMRVLLSSGDLAVAQQLAQKVGHHSRAADIPPWIKRMMAGWQARLWLAQGEMEPAARWVAERGLDADGELQFLHEFEHIVLARILMAQGRLDEAVTLLHRLCEAAETAERISSLIEILILQSLALEAQGNTDEALRTLERALVRAEPGGFVRILVDEGPPMARLLYEAAARGIVPDYARRLLSAFPLAEPAPAAPSIAPPQESELIEPLSERELEVLQLIAQGLTNPEIASRLFVAVNTVKSHTRNIYGKLGVHNRTKAVARARALGILPSI